MDLDGEPARCGDAVEHLLKLLHLVELQGGGVLSLVSPGKVPQLGEKLLATLGQVQLVAAAVCSAAATFDQFTRLQSVQHCNDPARADPHLLAHGTLADAGIAADEPEHPRIRRGDTQRPQSLFETARGVGAELGEQEGKTMVAARRHAFHGRSLDALFIACTIASMNRSSEHIESKPLTARRRPEGPHPGIVGAVSVSLFIASLAVMALLSGGHTLSSPFVDGSADFFAHHGLAARVSAMLLLGSSVPLGIYTATMYARLQRLGIRVPGPTIALFGGVTASVLLAGSALVTWTASQSPVAMQSDLTHALGFLAFASGGFAHLLGLGLLIAGIAVPALVLRLLPAPLTWAGLVIAAMCEFTVLAMIAEPLHVVIPIARFTALAWIIAAGFLMPRTRHRKNPQKEDS